MTAALTCQAFLGMPIQSASCAASDSSLPRLTANQAEAAKRIQQLSSLTSIGGQLATFHHTANKKIAYRRTLEPQCLRKSKPVMTSHDWNNRPLDTPRRLHPDPSSPRPPPHHPPLNALNCLVRLTSSDCGIDAYCRILASVFSSCLPICSLLFRFVPLLLYASSFRSNLFTPLRGWVRPHREKCHRDWDASETKSMKG